MKKMMIGIAAAATLLTAVPAMAQFTGGVRAGDVGVGIHIGPDRDYDEWRWRHRGSRSYGWYRGYDRDDCRVIVRERLRNGRVVVHTRYRC